MYLLRVHPGKMCALRMVSGAESDGIMAVVEINVQSCSCRAKNSKANLTRRSYTAVAVRFCASHSFGQHEEAMRAESRCSTATAETASGARWTTAES
jgi:hypothetical protein